MSERANKWIRRLAATVVCLLAVVAAALSYSGLRELALQAGIHPGLAWTYPLVLDGLGLVGGLSVLWAALHGLRTWYPWLLVLLGVAGSVAGNIVAASPDPVSRLVHASAPIALALTLEALLRLYRNLIRRSQDAAPHGDSPTPSSAPAPVVDTPQVPEAPSIRTEEPTVREESPVDAASAAKTTGQLPPADADEQSSTSAAPAAQVRSRQRARRSVVEQELRQLLAKDPTITASVAARQLGRDKSHVRKILNRIKAEEHAAAASGAGTPASNTGESSFDGLVDTVPQVAVEKLIRDEQQIKAGVS